MKTSPETTLSFPQSHSSSEQKQDDSLELKQQKDQFKKLYDSLTRPDSQDPGSVSKQITELCKLIQTLSEIKKLNFIYIEKLLLLTKYLLNDKSLLSSAKQVIDSALTALRGKPIASTLFKIVELNFIMSTEEKPGSSTQLIINNSKEIIAEIKLVNFYKFQKNIPKFLFRNFLDFAYLLLNKKYDYLAIQLFNILNTAFSSSFNIKSYHPFIGYLKILNSQFERWCPFYLFPNAARLAEFKPKHHVLALTNDNKIHYLPSSADTFLHPPIKINRGMLPLVESISSDYDYSKNEETIEEILKSNFEFLNQSHQYSPKRDIFNTIDLTIHKMKSETVLDENTKKLIDLSFLLHESLYILNIFNMKPTPCETYQALYQAINDFIKRLDNPLIKCIFDAEYLLISDGDIYKDTIDHLIQNTASLVDIKKSTPDAKLDTETTHLHHLLSEKLTEIAFDNELYVSDSHHLSLLERAFFLSSLEAKLELIFRLCNEDSEPNAVYLIHRYLSFGKKTDIEKFVVEMADKVLLPKAIADLIKSLAVLLLPDSPIPAVVKILQSNPEEFKTIANVFYPVFDMLFNPGCNLGVYLPVLDYHISKMISLNLITIDQYPWFTTPFLDMVLEKQFVIYRQKAHSAHYLLIEANFWLNKFIEHYSTSVYFPQDQEIFDNFLDILAQKIGTPLMLDKALRMHITASIINLAKKNIYLNRPQIDMLLSKSIHRVGTLRLAVTKVVTPLDQESKFPGKFKPLSGEFNRLIDGLTIVWMVYFAKLSVAQVSQQAPLLRKMIMKFLLQPLSTTQPKPVSSTAFTWESPLGLPHYCVKKPLDHKKADLISVSFSQIQKLSLMSMNLSPKQKQLLNIDESAENRLLSAKEQKQLIADRDTILIRDDKGELQLIPNTRKPNLTLVLSTAQMQGWFSEIAKSKLSTTENSESKKRSLPSA